MSNQFAAQGDRLRRAAVRGWFPAAAGLRWLARVAGPEWLPEESGALRQLDRGGCTGCGWAGALGPGPLHWESSASASRLRHRLTPSTGGALDRDAAAPNRRLSMAGLKPVLKLHPAYRETSATL